VLLDLSKVTYVDSATIGCLMDLYRQTTAAGGVKLAGVQKRVETMLTMTGAHNFLEDVSGRGERGAELRELAMRTIKTTTGARSARRRPAGRARDAVSRGHGPRELERSFEDMNREINHLIVADDRRGARAYLAESLFLNQVKYENDKLEAYMRKLEKK
jgi:hypothetical protein